jgi:hypothetical protein
MDPPLHAVPLNRWEKMDERENVLATHCRTYGWRRRFQPSTEGMVAQVLRPHRVASQELWSRRVVVLRERERAGMEEKRWVMEAGRQLKEGSYTGVSSISRETAFGPPHAHVLQRLTRTNLEALPAKG